MSQPKSQELLPCPLCGGKADLWRAHPENPRRNAWISCADRCLVLTQEFDSDEAAIAHWNRRAPSSPEVRQEAAVVELVEALTQIRAAYQAAKYVPGDYPVMPAKPAEFMRAVGKILSASQAPATPDALPASKEAVAAYKAKNAKHGWIGRGFSFDPGFLNLGREGDGNIGFAESDMQYERDDETGKDYVYCNVPASEFLALRDYLNEAFPIAHPPTDVGVSEALTDEMVERASAAYAKATGYYVEFHRGLRSESSDKIRRGIRAALSTAIPAGDGVPTWQPIETAPKDGTVIDLWCYWPQHDEHRRTADAYWRKDDWQFGDFARHQFVHKPVPLLWMRPITPLSTASTSGEG